MSQIEIIGAILMALVFVALAVIGWVINQYEKHHGKHDDCVRHG